MKNARSCPENSLTIIFPKTIAFTDILCYNEYIGKGRFGKKLRCYQSRLIIKLRFISVSLVTMKDRVNPFLYRTRDEFSRIMLKNRSEQFTMSMLTIEFPA